MNGTGVGQTGENLIPAAASTGSAALTTALNGELELSQPGNLVYSPLSLLAVLIMARLGARGRTASEMDQVLRFPPNYFELNDTLEELAESFAGIKGNPAGNLTLEMASRVYTQKNIGISVNYRSQLKRAFGVVAVKRVNFGESFKAARRINGWVKSVTHGKISELVSSDALSPSTSMVLVNGVYFKGIWEQSFNPRATRRAPFYLDERDKVVVDMMQRTGPFEYANLEDLDAKMILLPYQGGRLCMAVYVPNRFTGLASLQEELDQLPLTQVFQGLRQGSEVEIRLPKFRIESTLELVEPLRKIGLVSMFSSEADFTPMTREGKVKPQVTEVVQKAFVEVSEEGTEAAAATAIIMSRSAGSFRQTEFLVRADRPFYFQILDRQTNTIFFAGVVRNPIK